MSLKCSISTCDYNKKGYRGEQRSVFPIPSDPVRRQLWIDAIGSSISAPTPSTVICEAHFDARFLYNSDEPSHPIGESGQEKAPGMITRRQSVRTQKFKLTEDAVPKLPPSQTSSQSRKSKGEESAQQPNSKKRSSNRLASVIPSTSSNIQEAKPSSPAVTVAAPPGVIIATIRNPATPKNGIPDIPLTDFDCLAKYIENPPTEVPFAGKWLITLSKGENEGSSAGGGALFYQFDPSNEMPTILRSVTVDSCLFVKAYYDGQRIHPMVFNEEFQSFDISSSIISVSTWNQFVHILNVTDQYSGDKYTFDYSPALSGRSPYYTTALQALKERKNEMISTRSDRFLHEFGADDQEFSKLNFLMEQVALLNCERNQRAFSIPLNAWTQALMRKSVEAYKFMDRSGAVTVPRLVVDQSEDLGRRKPAERRVLAVGAGSTEEDVEEGKSEDGSDAEMTSDGDSRN